MCRDLRRAVCAALRRALRAGAVLAMASAATGFAAAGARADSAGVVHFMRMADSSFDQYTLNPSSPTREWITTHMWRMGVYSPYFDSRTSWYRNGWVYDDAYAIYRGGEVAREHPEWVLRDASGNALYIPFDCSGGACPQYAGDISNAAFRHYWIEHAAAEFARGYRGVFVDDVNMNMQVGDGHGQPVAPIDSTTGQPMTATQWRAYMASFMQQLRQALPSAEIVHNVIWFADGHAGASDANIRSELSSADFINLERGVNDAGLTGGNGPWSVNALLSYVDEVHALGRAIVLDGTSHEAQGLEYNLAAYLLVSTGSDAVSGSGQTPESWWGGWSVDLGEALDGRFAWNGLLRRDLKDGMVLLNPPGEPSRTVNVGSMISASGARVSAVTLAPASAAILTGGAPAAAPAAAPQSLTPTATTLAALPARQARPAKAPRHSFRRHRRHRHAHRRHGGRAVALRGSVKHAPRGRVTIMLEARRSHRWTRVGVRHTSLTGLGRFMYELRLSQGVRYRVRAVYEGAPGFAPSRSSFRQIAPRLR